MRIEAKKAVIVIHQDKEILWKAGEVLEWSELVETFDILLNPRGRE